MSGGAKEVLLALRPWSFTAAVIPILITTAISGTSFMSPSFLRVLVMGICAQAGGNLTNTYYDYVNGVDNKEVGERTLVERKMTPGGLLLLSIMCFLLAGIAIMPDLVSAAQMMPSDSVEVSRNGLALLVIFATGLLLAYFYTANPIGLKYRALGDITIFLCFGPLLMQCTNLILVGRMSSEVYFFTAPVGLLTEAILHGNNTRDIDSDRKAGAITLAVLLGQSNAILFYKALIVGSYASTLFIGLYFHYGCLLTLITVPIALDLMQKLDKGDIKNIDEDTAKFHLPFGLTLLLGILFTANGIL